MVIPTTPALLLLDEESGKYSNSSTFTVPSKVVVLTASSARKQEEFGTVRFHEDCNVEYERPASHCVVDPHELWYTARDYTLFRAAAAALAHEIVKMDTQSAAAASAAEHDEDDDDSYRTCVARLFAACGRARCETPSRSGDVECGLLSKRHHTALCRRLQISVTRVGLERLLVAELLHGKQERYRTLVRQVRHVQSLDFGTTEERQQTLRLACEKISRPSRMFAHEMAKAMATTTTLHTQDHEERHNDATARVEL